MLEDQREFLEKGEYICDGEINTRHETAFQEYLIKYFEFRKVYCKLNIVYSQAMRFAVKILYPFRPLLESMDSFGIIHNINGIMLMEVYRRKG